MLRLIIGQMKQIIGQMKQNIGQIKQNIGQMKQNIGQMKIINHSLHPNNLKILWLRDYKHKIIFMILISVYLPE